MDRHTLIHNKEKKRYEFHIENITAFIEYERNKDVLSLTRTIVPKELAGRGIAKALCVAVMEEIETQGLKMKPECSYIVSFVKKYPEYQKLIGK
ncbi:MAG TPA: N-acetyltransferase [Epsilonproteobacteria bacterium]|nr:N-acetyltransferase [Campylobacterota bacterium]